MTPLRGEYLCFVKDLLNEGLSVRFRVTGESMTPFLRSNSVVTLKKVLPGSLCIGDMILFERNRGILVIHRVVGKRRNQDGRYRFQTKGDAVKSFDAPVSSDRIVGKVYQIKKPAAGGQPEHIDLTTKTWIIINPLLAMVSLSRGLLKKTVHKVTPFLAIVATFKKDAGRYRQK